MLRWRSGLRSTARIPGRFRLVALSVALAVVTTSALLRGDVQFPEGTPAEHVSAIRQLAEYAVSPDDQVSALLADVGFDFEKNAIPGWRQFPAVRKLEAAYWFAECDQAGNGQKFLALVAKRLASKYGAAASDPILSHLLGEEDWSPKFKRPSWAEPGQPLVSPDSPPLRHRSVISRLVEYAENDGHGGLRGLIQDGFGLDELKTYEILRVSASAEDAAVRSYLSIPHGEREAALSRAIRRTQRLHVASRYDALLRLAARSAIGAREPSQHTGTTHPKLPPPSDSGGSGHPNTGPLSPPGSPSSSIHPQQAGSAGDAQGGAGPVAQPARRERPTLPDRRTAPRPELTQSVAPIDPSRASRYDRFVSRHYPTSTSRSFSRVILRAGGWGGVVFGSPVSNGEGVSAPLQLVWFPQIGNPDVGRLEFWLADGRVARLPMVLHDHVWAAYCLAYKGVGGMPPARDGEAIGLASLDLQSEQPFRDLTADGSFVAGKAWEIVLHPAIAGAELGWSTLMADVLPITDGLRKRLLPQCTDDEKEPLQDLIDAIDVGVENWKLRDRNAVITVGGGDLTVSASDEYRDTNESVMLSAEGFDYDSDGDEAVRSMTYGASFTRAVPVLVRLSREYDELAAFARVLSAVRWAKAAGAEFLQAPTEPTPITAPEWIAVIRREDSAITTQPVIAGLLDTGQTLGSMAWDRMWGQLGKAVPSEARVLAEWRVEVTNAITAVRAARRALLEAEDSTTRREEERRASNRPVLQEFIAQCDKARAEWGEAEFGSKEEQSASKRLDALKSEITKLLEAEERSLSQIRANGVPAIQGARVNRFTQVMALHSLTQGDCLSARLGSTHEANATTLSPHWSVVLKFARELAERD